MDSEREQKSKNSINTNLAELPDGITELIFSKLPLFKNLPVCRIVCKSWNNLISKYKSFDPPNYLFFALTKSPDYCYTGFRCIDFDPKHLGGMKSVASFSFHPDYASASDVTIISSCHGLLLCSFTWPKSNQIEQRSEICILNLITNEYLHLPFLINNNAPDYRSLYGFGFCPNTKQFKIARFSIPNPSPYPGESKHLLEIFSFGTNHSGWTRVDFPSNLLIRSHATYFNGAIYWVGNHYNHPLQAIKVICRLDLEDYKLDQFSLPRHGLGQDYGRHYETFLLGVLNDSLYLTFSITFRGLFYKYQVWKMEEDYSWIKVFVVPELPDPSLKSYHLQIIKTCEDGKILCLLRGLHLLLCDPNTGTTQLLTDTEFDISKHLRLYSIDYFNFNSISKILVGD